MLRSGNEDGGDGLLSSTVSRSARPRRDNRILDDSNHILGVPVTLRRRQRTGDVERLARSESLDDLASRSDQRKDHASFVPQLDFDAEYERWIRRRRIAADRNDKEYPVMGVAYSGGGVRSATVSLGVMQAVGRDINIFDYQSTVSGGGYIGAAYTCMTHWPVNGKHVSGFGTPESAIVEHRIRRRTNLLDRDQDHFWYTVAIYSTSVVASLITPLALLLLVAYPAMFFAFVYAQSWIPGNAVLGPSCANVVYDQDATCVSFAALCATLLAGLLLLTIIFRIFFAPCRRVRDPILVFLGRAVAWMLVVTVVVTIAVYTRLFFSDILVDWWTNYGDYVRAIIIGVAIIVLLLLSFSAFSLRNSRKVYAAFEVARSYLASLGPALLLGYFFFLLGVQNEELGGRLDTPEQRTRLAYQALYGMALALLGTLVGPNDTSLHYLYRDRLALQYMSRIRDDDTAGDGTSDASRTQMHEITPNSGAPFPIFNCALNVPTSKALVVGGRMTDLFEFQPLYCGSRVTGYRVSKDYASVTDTSIATAVAVSGAAVAPESGERTGLVARFIGFFLAVRMNLWVKNPAASRFSIFDWSMIRHVQQRSREVFGGGDEADRWLNLSDGGHFENLAVFSLARRPRMRFIMAIDAGQDPKMYLRDLARLARLLSVDIDATFDIDTDALVANGWAIGEIISPSRAARLHVLYLKPSRASFSRLNLDPHVEKYSRLEPDFPHHDTADQLFDEEQFEAYRRLGNALGTVAVKYVLSKIKDIEDANLDSIIDDIRLNYVASAHVGLRTSEHLHHESERARIDDLRSSGSRRSKSKSARHRSTATMAVPEIKKTV